MAAGYRLTCRMRRKSVCWYNDRCAAQAEPDDAHIRQRKRSNHELRHDTRMSRMIRHFSAWVFAAAATGGLACVVQTQINIARLVDLGAPIGPAVRGWATLEDLMRFMPVMVAIAAAALAPALLVGHAVWTRLPVARRPLVLAVAAVAGLWAAFSLMSMVTPMPHLVVATDDWPGLAAMCLMGVPGGVIYAWSTPPDGVPHGAAA